MASIRMLTAVLEDTRRRLDMPDNDYTWSSWEDRAAALAEIDSLLAILRNGFIPSIGVLFAPTGPVQEVSVSSGWSSEFARLADAYETAMASTDDQCRCQSDPVAKLETIEELGLDYQQAEVSVLRCPACGQRWLHYLYEFEGFTGSGRWYRGALPADAEASLPNSKGMLEGMEWYFYGGSYYDGQTGKISGPIRL